MDTNLAYLPQRGALLVRGDDARAFLQGLVTNNVTRLDEGSALFSALLTPQGKFLHDFFMLAHPEGVLLEMARERIADLIKRLSMYKLRSNVSFEDLSAQFSVFAASGGAALPEAVGGYRFADPRHPSLGMRALLPTDTQVGAAVSDDAYDAMRLTLGIPEGDKDLVVDRSILLECGYDELNAIDFAKGCYVGQEVTARSKHRAALRKFMHKVLSGQWSVVSGTPIMLDNREIGEMRSSRGGIGLAMLQVAEVEKAKAEGKKLMAGEVIIQAQLPDWVKTKFAQ